MTDNVWAELHKRYKEQDWIDKPSIFAQQAIQYFPKNGRILELGAGQAQDACYFSSLGYDVLATDIEESALGLAEKKAKENAVQIDIQKVDLRDELPFKDSSFDVVYAHLSLHYFEYQTTVRLIGEIERVLKPGGVLAFLTNSVNDPDYKMGEEIESDYFRKDGKTKRYLSEETARSFTQYYEVNLLDELGETYKDNEKGVHNLVRFIGKKPMDQNQFEQAIPYTGAIIERTRDGVKELLMQTRWKPHTDTLYSGTLEFPAGVLDTPYENIYDTLAREIKEECGLVVKSIQGDSRSKVYSPNGTDEVMGFRPFCCTQQLKDGKPWVGFIFICEVQDGEPVSKLGETRDAKWIPIHEVKEIFRKTPEKLFGLSLPALEYYFSEQ